MDINDRENTNEILHDSEIPIPLSPEYFDLLQNRYLPSVSSNEAAEKIANLLLAPDIPYLLSTSATPSQAYQYLLSIPDDLSAESFIYHDVLPGIMYNIRCACIRLSLQNRSKITQSGILIKLSKLAGNMKNNNSPFSRNDVSTDIDPSKSNNNEASSLVYSLSGDVHVDFLYICIISGQYHFARLHFCPFMSSGFPSLPTSSEGFEKPNGEAIDGQDSAFKLSDVYYRSSVMENLPFIQNISSYLKYRYFRGIICYELDEINSAVQEWSMCISTPARSTSDIVIEAYKKLILARGLQAFLYGYGGLRNDVVSLESDQKSHPTKERSIDVSDSKTHALLSKFLCTPRGTSTTVSRKLKNLASGKLKVYSRIIEAVQNCDTSVLQTLIDSLESSGDASCMDGSATDDETQYLFSDNRVMATRFIGLINLEKLRRIANAYDAIPLSRLAIKLNVSTVQDCVVFLTQLNMKLTNLRNMEPKYSVVRFSIDEKSGVVYFDEEGEDDQCNLNRGISDYIEIARRVKALDISITSSTKYQIQANRTDNAVKKSRSSGKETVRKVANVSY